MKRDPVIVLAALSAAIAIGAGAFGAHGVTGKPAEWLRTGSIYQLAHAVAAVALVAPARRVAVVLLIGAAIFAGALYALALGSPRILGAVAPIGGATMIAGWIWLAFKRR